ncbi:MAG: DUF2299 family protein [Promethearchaeota archaeon]
MSIKENKIKHIIREYLLEEGILRKNLDSSKIEFGFQFSFPPGSGGQIMAVLKPKNKKLIIISIGTQIARPHVEALSDKKLNFFMDLRKSFLLKDVFFRIDVKNNRYEISDQIFLNNNKLISKNSFFKSIRKVFNSAVYSNIILGEYCSGKIKPEDFTKNKELDSGSDFSLYS